MPLCDGESAPDIAARANAGESCVYERKTELAPNWRVGAFFSRRANTRRQTIQIDVTFDVRFNAYELDGGGGKQVFWALVGCALALDPCSKKERKGSLERKK